ncbi:3-hydroxylacyl-ACP dehydratase [Roseomonas sp. M0104]|uniref:3-hydroxylacyl-ACP dehydratase n=1 Tax=Teichococcus coralli TaxID=2545983 RepID=A0A845BDV8_9PROT|nr:3-hydroxylacyl-ACP dehydratase [Pseudoroseomonas coralli]MXP64234.1 3-hydroxylacyl-ACP dehydratase [Pseudoroseomonas coralli]
MLKPSLDHAAIAARVPHAGAMCLLDRAERWEDDSIVCHAVSHRDPANPLRRAGMLPAVSGVEYALQAMALHGALTGDGAAQPAGYLASLRGVTLAVARLDDRQADLRIVATAVAREARSFIYAFQISAAGQVLLSGQAAVILPEAA